MVAILRIIRMSDPDRKVRRVILEYSDKVKDSNLSLFRILGGDLFLHHAPSPQVDIAGQALILSCSALVNPIPR